MARKLAVAVLLGVFPRHGALQIMLYSVLVAALAIQPALTQAANRTIVLSQCSAILTAQPVAAPPGGDRCPGPTAAAGATACGLPTDAVCCFDGCMRRQTRSLKVAQPGRRCC